MRDFENIITEFEEALNNGSHKKWLAQADYFLRINFQKEEIPYTAEDIVSEVITKTVDESGRNWDKNKVPLNAYMYNAIRSEVSNLTQKLHRYENVDFNNQEYAARTTAIYNRFFISLEEIESANDYMELYNNCLETLADDEECSLVLMELHEGKSEKEIALSLGISLQHTLAVKQQIRRKLRKKIKFKPEG